MKPIHWLFPALVAVTVTIGCSEVASDSADNPELLPVSKLTRAELDKQFDALQGKVVLVNFWATWCGPCIKELPSLVAMQEKYGAHGLHILGLSIDDRPINQVATFAQKNKINYPVFVVGEDASVKWGAFEAIPMTLLFDRTGKRVWTHEGYASREAFEKQIRSALELK